MHTPWRRSCPGAKWAPSGGICMGRPQPGFDALASKHRGSFCKSRICIPFRPTGCRLVREPAIAQNSAPPAPLRPHCPSQACRCFVIVDSEASALFNVCPCTGGSTYHGITVAGEDLSVGGGLGNGDAWMRGVSFAVLQFWAGGLVGGWVDPSPGGHAWVGFSEKWWVGLGPVKSAPPPPTPPRGH